MNSPFNIAPIMKSPLAVCGPRVGTNSCASRRPLSEDEGYQRAFVDRVSPSAKLSATKLLPRLCADSLECRVLGIEAGCGGRFGDGENDLRTETLGLKPPTVDGASHSSEFTRKLQI